MLNNQQLDYSLIKLIWRLQTFNKSYNLKELERSFNL